MLITISGPIGSGKSTAARALAEELDYEHVSGGDIFRSLADERGYTPLEFNKLAEEDDQIDRDLDRRLRQTAREEDDLVLESRLSGWMAGEYADIRVWLDAPETVRAGRVAEREGTPIDEAKRTLHARAESEVVRYRRYYDIDFTDPSIYDLSVNTARWGPEGVREIVRTAVAKYEPDDDEGAFPIEGVNYEF